jgi:hypothetical protein
VINRTYPEFWRRFNRLPVEIQLQTREAFRLFRHHPRQPSLRFKALKAHPNVYSVRIGLHYRAVALRSGDTVRWFWIGSHSDFDREFS